MKYGNRMMEKSKQSKQCTQTITTGAEQMNTQKKTSKQKTKITDTAKTITNKKVTPRKLNKEAKPNQSMQKSKKAINKE